MVMVGKAFGQVERGVPVWSCDFPPLLLISSMIVTAFAWNAWVGIRWTPSLWVLLLIPTPTFFLCWYYSAIRPDPKFAQFTFYAGLWLLYPIFGARLSYLAAATTFPLRDGLLQAWDRALGFDWDALAHFIYARPWLRAPLLLAYLSYAVQPFLTVAILCKWAPRNRNAEFLTSVIVALIITISISAFMPALSLHGLREHPEWGQVMRALRSGSREVLIYTGIIAFPSFHTVMAILFIFAHRGIRQSFFPFLALNVLMLFSIPVIGYHYLVDELAGVLVACISAVIAHRLYARFPGDRCIRDVGMEFGRH